MKISSLKPPQLLVVGFMAVILLGSILLSTPWASNDGLSSDWLTALFTATTAVCVTGLVVVDTGTHWSIFGQIVIMLLIQIGGLGIMSFATLFALLLRKKIFFKQRIIMQQALGNFSVQGIVNIFKYLLIFSFLFEAIGALILTLHWLPTMGFAKALWFGIFHAISAFNNAGIDLFGNFNNLTGFSTDLTINMVISSLIIFGGLGFYVIYELYNYKNDRKLSLHSKVVLITTGALIVLGTVIIFAAEYNHALRELAPAHKLLAAYFQSVSPRTAGFNTIDLNTLFLPTQLLIMALMFVGGSPGSTAGGIKTSTFTVLWVAIFSILRGKKDAEIFKRRIEANEVSRALAIALLSISVIFMMTFLISFSNDYGLVRILFEVVSALGTVGLSLNLTPQLNEIGRILIIITMFLGRLGPITIGYALVFRQQQANVRYPEGKIMIG